MRNRPKNLPEFERPPISEVVLGLQFATLSGFRTFHSGQLASKFPDLPIISERPELSPIFETFGNSSRLNPTQQIEFVQGPPVPRYWMESVDRCQLVQVQQDRFLCNWRKVRNDDVYPRYEKLKDIFQDRIRKFESFLAESNLGEVKPNQCEVSYINSIELPEKSDPRPQVERILKVWSKDYVDDQGRTIEDAQIQFRYLLQEEGAKPYGRLYVAIQPAITRTDLKPIVQMTLTVRGLPKEKSLESAYNFMDKGRNAIVRAFASMTREEMHKYWGITNV